MSEEWKADWQKFEQTLRVRQDRLISEISGAWNDVASLQRLVLEALQKQMLESTESKSLKEMVALSQEAGRVLLEEPVKQYQYRTPVRRALSAIEEYHSAAEELLHLLPKSVPISGREFVKLTGLPPIATWFDTLIGAGRRGCELPLQDILADHFLREDLRRQILDGSTQLLLAKACLELREPWQAYRVQTLSRFGGHEFDRDVLDRIWNQWLQRTDAVARQASEHLEQYRSWAKGSSVRLSRALQRGGRGFVRAPGWKSRLLRKFWQRNVAYWSKQQRAIYSVLEMDLCVKQLGTVSIQTTALGLDSLQQEHQSIQRTAESLILWLDEWSPTADPFEPPIQDARLLNLEERVDLWAGKLSAAARQLLPEKIDSLNPKRRLAPVYSRWRTIYPRKAYLSGIETYGKPIYSEGLREIVELNLAIAREMEHARQVVEYGLESARTEGGFQSDLLTEAKKNAQTLLSAQARVVLDVDRSLLQTGVSTLVSIGQSINSELEISRLGLFDYLTHLQGRHAFNEFSEFAIRFLRAGTRNLGLWVDKLLNSFLLRIGWRFPTRPVLEPVMERPTLAHVLEVKLASRELPQIYKRLFRLAPVEDRRFLVGRDEEIEGFEQALAQWDSGRFASVLLVGARGSGKTSLLNCASSSVFAGRKLVRGQFDQRLTSASQVEQFILKLLSVPAGTDLDSALSGERRVVVLEEFERAFLRKVNGFDGIRFLLQLLHPSTSSTLWVFSLNDDAFRYLDVAVDLGRFFSHRVNAMSVKKEDLTNAIMQRHNLSGLRLKFSPLPPEDPRVSRMRQWLGIERDPEKMFLDALYEQSGGVFRSAFELWQGCIERVEAGVVEMRQPLVPNYSRLQLALDSMDYFTLVSIMQHGSTTDSEVAEVLCEPVNISRMRLDRLLAIEILEDDPIYPGVRIRPEARRFVTEALIRVNLL